MVIGQQFLSREEDGWVLVFKRCFKLSGDAPRVFTSIVTGIQKTA